MLEGEEYETYELVGDSAYTLTELAAEISHQTGKTIPYNNLTEAQYANILKSFALSEGLAQMLADSDLGASKGGLFDDAKQFSALIGTRQRRWQKHWLMPLHKDHSI